MQTDWALFRIQYEQKSCDGSYGIGYNINKERNMASGRSEPRATLGGKGCRSLARLVRVDPNTSVIKL